VATKPKLPPAKFREWAAMLLHIESLADAACYTQPGSHQQNELLRRIVRETRALRHSFVRQMEKPN
jgi:hypothetical protein